MSAVHCCQAAAPILKTQRSGVIVNISIAIGDLDLSTGPARGLFGGEGGGDSLHPLPRRPNSARSASAPIASRRSHHDFASRGEGRRARRRHELGSRARAAAPPRPGRGLRGRCWSSSPPTFRNISRASHLCLRRRRSPPRTESRAMNLDYVRNRRFEPIVQSYDARDLRALRIEPRQSATIRWTTTNFPSSTKGAARSRCRANASRSAGRRSGMTSCRREISWRRILHGEQSFYAPSPLPVHGAIRAQHRIDAVEDKGPGRGALDPFRDRDRRRRHRRPAGEPLARSSSCATTEVAAGGERRLRRRPFRPRASRPPAWTTARRPKRRCSIVRRAGTTCPSTPTQKSPAGGLCAPISHGLNTFRARLPRDRQALRAARSGAAQDDVRSLRQSRLSPATRSVSKSSPRRMASGSAPMRWSAARWSWTAAKPASASPGPDAPQAASEASISPPPPLASSGDFPSSCAARERSP